MLLLYKYKGRGFIDFSDGTPKTYNDNAVVSSCQICHLALRCGNQRGEVECDMPIA
jgi:hypothetical protein